ncbi:TetR/AcrR family transcriptional regulator [Actinoplanes sp. TBRC 11911]|uniref:TetR/AcrR family transcriptional regulator n=1 Tax=Actinoplanes sp. TBRC 11911 TaxID=2729386 RepID=UPI00145CF0D5|nr:TetR/AcrR family transcriptional regulator [Actinoplanes sp. TBRC 11911]NMO50132.1 TetR/AcrR family transcriptional regulator [Actinoplanes sp. TBRC 11911]
MTGPRIAHKRPRGERSRQVILDAAAELAATEGIDGLSIGNLTTHIGMSKSAFYAHFPSKEELQLATVADVHRRYREHLLDPAAAQPDGLSRLRALADGYLGYAVELPGGCFFASVAAELDTRPGPVRDRVAAYESEWLGLLTRYSREAGAADPAQLAFEVHAALRTANNILVMYGDHAVVERARRSIERSVRDAMG